MANWQTIEKLRNIFIERYTTSKLSTELEKACSEEYELMRDYNGRQILELLQNVDDACSGDEGSESAVYIKYTNNILEVGNTGTTFTQDTIERLCLGRASSKSSSNIGNKGTGFRSLLNDAEWIEVYSGDFSIRFSLEYTQNLFAPYIDKDNDSFCELISTQLNNWKKDYPLRFPILNCPEEIKRIDTQFDTLIRIKVNEDNETKTTSISNQLKMPFYKSILFMPNINKIVIETDNTVRQYEKYVVNEKYYDDVLIQDNDGNIEQYYLFKKHVNILNDKYADLIIAYPVNSEYDISKEKLYCYFPIRNFQTPIHALIHAPFITNNSRDDVPNDNNQVNYHIFRAVMYFIKEVGEKLKDLNDANPIEFVTPIDFKTNKMWDSDTFNLEDQYLELLCDSKIIPTVNNEYISINDGPKIIDGDFPAIFKGKGFEKLVKRTSNQNVYEFIKQMCSKQSLDYRFESNALSYAIDEHNEEYNTDEAVEIFIWWSKHYQDANVLPRVLKDTNNNWIQKEFKVFLPTNDGVSVLDSSLEWVNLSILKQEYVTKLIEVIKRDNYVDWEKIANKYTAERTNEKRLLDAYSDIFFATNFTEQSSSRVIVSEISNQVDSVEKAKSFFTWFYENYKEKMAEESELSKLKFKLPDRDDNLKDTKKLYFGSEYDNSLAEKLFVNTEYSPLCSLEKIYEGTDAEDFKEFIRISGVLYYPEIKQIHSDSSEYDMENFKSYVRAKYRYSFNLNYLETYSIDNFNQLLCELSTKEIVELLSKDLSLSSLILSTDKRSKVKQNSNWTPYEFNSNEYVLYILNNTRWIEICGKRYSPKQIIKYGKLRDKLDSVYGIQERELIGLLDEDIVRRYNLEFKEDFSGFTSDEILDMLKKLPEVDNGEISRKLYIDIIKGKRDQAPDYEPVDIKLMAKDGKFHPNQALIYVDKSIPQKIDNSKKIDIPIQHSTDTISKWFGVNKVELNLTMEDHTPITEFNEFDDELKDLKVCILSIMDEITQNYVSKLKRMRVVPCKEIRAMDNSAKTIVDMNDYSFIKEGNCFYLKINTTEVNELRSSHEYAMAVIEMFKEAVSPQIPMDLAELLIGKKPKDKRDKISEKYGIDKWLTSYETLFEKSVLSRRIEQFFVDNGLEEGLLASVNSIDYSADLLEGDYKILIKCLQKIERDVCDINDILETAILDIRGFIKTQCVNELIQQREVYKASCHAYLVKNPDEQGQFLSLLESYNNYDFSDVEFSNSILYSIEEMVYEKFPILKTNINHIADCDGIYNKHYNDCIGRDGIEKQDFDYYIDNNKEMKSLLYFDSFENVLEGFYHMADNTNESVSTNALDDITGADTSTVNTKLIANVSNVDSSKKPSFGGEFGARKSKEIADRNEKAGEEAERIAYVELKKCYPNLIWNSKYSAVPADKNNQPPNGIVCDMWNSSNEGNTYFEVKSSTSEFEMSINEYESMKNNKVNYVVILVNRETKTISWHSFDELEEFKKPSGYKFIFKQQSK